MLVNLWIGFIFHTTRTLVTLSPQHSHNWTIFRSNYKLTIILPPNIRRKYSLCVWWIHFMNATTSLICHVKCWGAEGPLSATKSVGWGLESPPSANGFRRGVLIVCCVLWYLEGSGWWQWSSMNFIEQRLSRVILQQPLQMYSCILKRFSPSRFIFKCFVYANLLLFSVLPTASFVKYLQHGFCANISSFKAC